MKLSDFKFDLPPQLIAQYPLPERDQAKLMVIDRKSHSIRHTVFSSLNDFLPKKSVLVLNDSRVIPARLLGRKERSGGEVEIFVLKKLSDGYSCEALLKPLKRIKPGDKILFNGSGIYAYVDDKDKGIVRFNKKNVFRYLNRIGHVPLPPYIHRPDEELDREYYQTVYAKTLGSVASPTAGLHFTKELLLELIKAGHDVAKVTLHVNYGTFKPVVEENITQHEMHPEEYAMPLKTFRMIKEARAQGRKIVAVGTTSCRTIEAVGQTHELKGNTKIFIYPGYRFQMADCLLTNFHLPLTTLLMLACAFGGQELILKSYQEAVKEKYRFYSYGDCMLIV